MIKFLEKYKSLKLIQDNGSKIIYSGINTKTIKKVIIKIYSESDYNGSDFERLRNNIKSRKLIKNDNIVKIYNIERKIYSGTSYYILELEYVDGESLESLIEFSTFSEIQALQIISQVIHGLKSLKKAKLKLENISTRDILLDVNGTIKIDLSGDILSKEERTNNNQSDIYLLGVILYKLITKEDYNITKKINKSMISNVLSEILDRCLNKSSVIRYYDLDEMLSNINEYIYYGLEDNNEKVEISESKGRKRKLVKVTSICIVSGLILASISFAIRQIANLKDDTNDTSKVITASNKNKYKEDIKKGSN